MIIISRDEHLCAIAEAPEIETLDNRSPINFHIVYYLFCVLHISYMFLLIIYSPPSLHDMSIGEEELNENAFNDHMNSV